MTTDNPVSTATKKPRDVRLDFFRGLCLVIIYIAHIWGNPWAQWIPARFGFSDATEIFVFCSGMASAVAFGSVFRNRGFLLGASRVAFRCWQVYWSHIGVFLVGAATMVILDAALSNGASNYVKYLKLTPLFGPEAKAALVGLLTLTWVPNYFDILPMYLVLLVMLPAIVALQRLGTGFAAGAVLLIWAGANFGLVQLSAEPWGTRGWYFDPFGWQLVFFTGYAFMSGWLPEPRVDRRLIYSAIAVVLLTIPFAWWPLLEASPPLMSVHTLIEPLIDKTRFGPFRYIHFLSLAYLSYVAAGEGGRRLKGPIVELFRRLGQQSLAIFMSGLVLSFVSGAILDALGRNVWSVPLINLTGIALLFGIARVTAYFKKQPWQHPVHPHTRAAVPAPHLASPARTINPNTRISATPVRIKAAQ